MPRSSAAQKTLFAADQDTADAVSMDDSSSPLKGSRKGLKSPIAWYGGKAYYAEWLIERFPDHRVYVEPFGGAANVLLRKPKSEVEVYNDVDDRVVNLFRVIRDPEQFERLRMLLDLTPYARGEFADLLELPPSDDPVEKARRFFAICRQARGGMGMSKLSKNCWAYSRRTRRDMAEPVSKYLSAIDGLEEVAARLRTVMIESRPAIELIPRYDGEDSFFYLDPPYMPETRHGNKAATYAHEMSVDDHAALLDALLQIKGKAMLSGYAAPLYDEKLKAWRREELKTKAHMANSGEERTEVIWFNY
jgi:DNA adenine methylase